MSIEYKLMSLSTDNAINIFEYNVLINNVYISL